MPPISLCVCMCIPLSLLGNGSVKTLSLQRIHTQQYNCWRHLFYAVCVVSKESRRLVLPRTSCFLFIINLMSTSASKFLFVQLSLFPPLTVKLWMFVIPCYVLPAVLNHSTFIFHKLHATVSLITLSILIFLKYSRASVYCGFRHATTVSCPPKRLHLFYLVKMSTKYFR
jgi:hypothetical protein